MQQKLETVKFVCLDCETTGLDNQDDRIIEIGVILFDLDNNFQSFETLVNPERDIPKESQAIHHITEDMVVGKPKIKEVLPAVLEIVGNHIIVGHGIEFDIAMIANSAKRSGINTTITKNQFMDTLRLARSYGQCRINSLEELRKHFHIDSEVAHRAMSDVIVNIAVFKRLIYRYKTLGEILKVLSRPILLRDMPLGKHKGRSFQEIPIEYLQWAANKDFDQDLIYSLRRELKRRKAGGLFNQAGNPFQNL